MAKILTGGDVFGYKGNIIYFKLFLSHLAYTLGQAKKIKHTYFKKILSPNITHVNFRLIVCKLCLLVNMSGRPRRGWHAKCAGISPTLLNKFSFSFLTIT